MGRPPHEPTDRVRELVKKRAAIGMPHAEIADLVGISKKTLAKHYAKELSEGRAGASQVVRNVLFEMATNPNYRFTSKQQRAAEFWAKMGQIEGFKETQAVEHSGKIETIYTTGEEDGV